MKRAYEKPSILSEAVFETLAGGCSMIDNANEQCDPANDGTNLDAPSQ